MADKYLRVTEIQPQPNNTIAKCECGEHGKYKMTVQINKFDDCIVWVCEKHKRKPLFNKGV